jgi:hypothetical protein
MIDDTGEIGLNKIKANSPHRFVGDGHARPVRFIQNFGKGFQLAGTNIHGSSSLSFLLLFTNAKHDIEAGFNGNFALFGANLDWFTRHIESFTTFRMSDDHPRAADILDLEGTHFASVGTLRGIATTVLGADGNVLAELFQQHRDVKERAAHSDFDIVRDGTCLVEDFNKSFILGNGTVAFPVPSDKIATFTIDQEEITTRNE